MNNVINLFGNTQQSPIIETLPAPQNDAVILNDTVFKNYAGKDQQLFDVETLPISSPYGIIEDKKGLFVNEKKYQYC